MAELADALDLGSSGETRTGSIPARRTKIMKIPLQIEPFRYNIKEGFYIRNGFCEIIIKSNA